MASLGPTSPPASNNQAKSRWDFAEQFIKIATGLLGLVYAAGFLVVSIHHARYGIIMFEFLRSRVFAAGLVFAILTAIPIVAISRVFGVFGLRNPAGTLKVKAEHQGYHRVCLLGLFPIVVYALALAAQLLFKGTPTPQASLWWIVLGLGAPGIAVAGMRIWINSHPLPVSVACLVAGACFLFAVRKWVTFRETALIVYWFCGVAVAFTVVRYMFLSEDSDRKRFDWERWGFSLLTVVFIFATVIYGRIKPAWGGGVVAPVTVHFARTTPFSSSTDTKAYLVDETDKGYYLTHDGDDRKATFIPRDAIAALDYEELK